MKAFLILLVSLTLAGCDGLTNEEIISAHKQCKDAGLKSAIYRNGWTLEVIKVECVLPEEQP